MTNGSRLVAHISRRCQSRNASVVTVSGSEPQDDLQDTAATIRGETGTQLVSCVLGTQKNRFLCLSPSGHLVEG